MRELRPGLWHWEAPHPEWEPSEPWDQVVSSYAIDDGDRVLLFDPIAAPSEIDELAAGRETVIVLTAPWHERDTRSLVERLSMPVFVPPPDEGSPDVAWLLAGDTGEGHLYSAGDRLPVGVDGAFAGREPNDLVLWIESRRAVIAGDTLVDFGQGLEIPLVWRRGRDARAGRREAAPAARAAGRACARDARRAQRPGRPRARALLRPNLARREARRCGRESSRPTSSPCGFRGSPTV